MNKELRFRAFTLSSLMAALAVMLIIAGTFVPNLSLSCAALAGFCPLVSLSVGGKRAALMTYGASALLCLLTGLSGEAGLVYICVFGLYPTVRDLAKRSKSRAMVWAWKFLYANISLGVLLGLSLLILPELFETDAPLLVLWLLYQAVFVVYDFAMLRLERVLLQRLKIDKQG